MKEKILRRNDLTLAKALLDEYVRERKMLVHERKVTFDYIALYDRYERFLRNNRLEHIGIKPNRWYSCSKIINAINERIKTLDVIMSNLRNELGENDDIKLRELKENLKSAKITLENYQRVYKRFSEFDMEFKNTHVKSASMAKALGVNPNEVHEARYFMDKMKPLLKKAMEEVEKCEEELSSFKAELYALGKAPMLHTCYDASDNYENMQYLEERHDEIVNEYIHHVSSGYIFRVL